MRQRDLTAETTELLQTLIRNRCVNDGDPASGQEVRNADVLGRVLEDGGLDLRRYEPRPGRTSLLTTLEGTDPRGPTLLLMGHTDVVPASPEDWREDPFGGELIDGEVWGRGAIDMLNLTASMALAVRELAREGRRRPGTLKYLAVADEEASGTWGAEWLTEHHWDEVGADYVLTEFGGVPADLPAGRRIVIATSEKGLAWRRLVVHGTPGHGSMPWAADNALFTAAEVVRRLQAEGLGARITDAWRAFVASMGLPEELAEVLLDAGRVREAFELLDLPTARYCHAATHTTFSPNVVHGGTKTNVIPDRVELDVDVRTLPGVTAADVDALFAEVLEGLRDRVEVTAPRPGREATQSPTDTPLYDVLRRRVEAAHPGAAAAPWMNVGATDAAFFRRRGAVAYGAGLFGPRTSLQEFSTRFHGHDERIDVDSLGLSAQLWLDVVDELLG